MKIIWSDDQYFEIEKPFGSKLVGLRHGAKRPDKIRLDYQEFLHVISNLDVTYPYFYDYVQMLSNINIKLEITNKETEDI